MYKSLVPRFYSIPNVLFLLGHLSIITDKESSGARYLIGLNCMQCLILNLFVLYSFIMVLLSCNIGFHFISNFYGAQLYCSQISRYPSIFIATSTLIKMLNESELVLIDDQLWFQKVPSDTIFLVQANDYVESPYFSIGYSIVYGVRPLKFYCVDPYFQDGVQDTCHNRKTVKMGYFVGLTSSYIHFFIDFCLK